MKIAMKPDPYEHVSMHLHGCDVGWIYMIFSTPTSKVNIRLSTCFDPIPDFIHWMEALTTDVMHCGFGVEEEGPEKYFFARTHWQGRYQLTISEGDFADAEEYPRHRGPNHSMSPGQPGHPGWMHVLSIGQVVLRGSNRMCSLPSERNNLSRPEGSSSE